MKLKKLQLAGFKSFADRTEFEFDDGISCVVGPNGCGKSNIVDAIKWVLGERSAKNLRGGEMMDVIFNGSSSRKPAGMAEITLVFDNNDGVLRPSVDDSAEPPKEVSIARRLFRGGQSEYLINKIPCRLKDVRELFMDTGVGASAYSIIEQGRVEQFLQASQEERRAIFDEAAGISKYKARKKETLRKLERVEQNLLRLADILAEVEKQLRSIKYHAGKARSYKTHSERLNELMSLFLLANYHTLSAKRNQLKTQLDEANDSISTISTLISNLESAQAAAENERDNLERTERELRQTLATNDTQISQLEVRKDMYEKRIKELKQECIEAAQKCERYEARAEQHEQTLCEKNIELERLAGELVKFNTEYDSVMADFNSRELKITELKADLEDEKSGTIDLLRRTNFLHNEISKHDVRSETLGKQKDRLNDQAEGISAKLQQLLSDRAEYKVKLDDIEEIIVATKFKLQETENSTNLVVQGEKRLQEDISSAREQRIALDTRKQTLNKMLQGLEGLDQGVRKVLEARRVGKLTDIVGILGDFIDTDPNDAGMVETALRGAEQLLLTQNIQQVLSAREELADVLDDTGAVEILCMDSIDDMPEEEDFHNHPLVQGCVCDLVRINPELYGIIKNMLGKTLITETFADAVSAAQQLPKGYRFVTRNGELLEANGRIRLGMEKKHTGVISMRSELSQITGQLDELNPKIEELDRQLESAHSHVKHLMDVQQKLKTSVYEASTEKVDCNGKIENLDKRIEEIEHEAPAITREVEEISQQIESAVRARHEANEKAGELEQVSKQREEHIEKLKTEIEQAEDELAQANASKIEIKTSLAGMQEKKTSVRTELTSISAQRDQMSEDIASGRAAIEQNRQTQLQMETDLKNASNKIEELFNEKQKLQTDLEDLEATRKSIHDRLVETKTQLVDKRKGQELSIAKRNGINVEQGQNDTNIDNLITRASNEMQMDLVALHPSYEHDEQRDWEAVESEIAELKGKINRLGTVNIDAIDEQDDLEKRREFLAEQIADVQASQNKLNDLIRKINQQSNQMFRDTFDAVRENFRELFRKLFGGGKADVMLVDPDDILSSPIEIVAQPPGKDLTSISLLSGGEKTMAALALLFSFFKSRPSPFCLLDEVDAALDEANNERYNTLVREFAETSQFIMISHSKRTMTMANILYGVTMQTPGVSGRFSVKIENVNAKGELQTANA